MSEYDFKRLADRPLLARAAGLAGCERVTTARFLAVLAEIDDRKLYASEGYPSLFAFCVRALGLSDDEAAKRIQVARVAYAHPALFPVLADGRLHMTAVRLLAPYLDPGNVDDLIVAATRRTCDEIRELIARRFPQAEELVLPEVVPAVRPLVAQHAPGHAPAQHAPGHVPESVRPLSPQRFELHATIGAEAHKALVEARELSGKDVEGVLGAALALYVSHLQKRKHAATSRPRHDSRRPKGPRTIPADVKRFVWARDGGSCAFTGPAGRCGSRMYVEYDHVVPVALGGESTIHNVRLLCREHNQSEADRRLGKELMDSRRARAERDRDVISGLRSLGVGAAQARAVVAELDSEASLEDALRQCLKRLAPTRPRPVSGQVVRSEERIRAPEPIG